MSKQNIQLFYEKVGQDVQLQQKLNRIFHEEQETYMENLVTIANTSGYDFTKSDFQQVVEEGNFIHSKADDELNDDQLEAVSGGLVTGLIVTAGFGLVVTAGVGLAIGLTIYTESQK